MSTDTGKWKFNFSDEGVTRLGVAEITVATGADWFADAIGTVVHFMGMDVTRFIESVVDPRGQTCTLEVTESGEMVPQKIEKTCTCKGTLIPTHCPVHNP